MAGKLENGLIQAIEVKLKKLVLVRKKFIMKTFSILLDQVENELPSKSSPYKGPIRIVLAAILARQIDSLRVGVC